jgi:hypothetical protein
MSARIEQEGEKGMFDLKEYATKVMQKENSNPTIEKEWKVDPNFVPGMIDGAESESPRRPEERQ